MSSTSFTHVTNTTVSGSQILSTLTGNDIISLQYHAAISTCLPLYLEDLGTTVNLTADGLTQAAVSRLLVDGTDLTEDTYLLKIGTDSTSQAQAFVRLFDLTTTSKKVILNIQYSGTTLASGDGYVIQFGTAAPNPGAANNVRVFLNGSTDGPGQVLFSSSAANVIPGTVRGIEVYASNLTSGSEIVNFNVTTGGVGAQGPVGPQGPQGPTGPAA